jgi:hypothetical protein
LPIAVALKPNLPDGPDMDQEWFQRESLSKGQKQSVVQVVSDRYGNSLVFAEFSTRIADLLDDIPGLETRSDSYQESVINELWSLYHEQQ